MHTHHAQHLRITWYLMYSIKKELLIMQSTTGKLAISARKYVYFIFQRWKSKMHFPQAHFQTTTHFLRL